MSSATRVIRLYCVAPGDSYTGNLDLFSVEIAEDADVLVLKELIKEEMKPLYDTFSTSRLKLFDINLFEWDDFDDDFRYRVESGVQNTQALDPTRKIGDIFPAKSFQDENLHIAIQPPGGVQFVGIVTLDALDVLVEAPASDGLGVFGADDIQEILQEMNYEIKFIPLDYPEVAMVLGVSDSPKTGFLKFVPDGREEVPILKYLSGIESLRNHTVACTQFWPVRGGQLILMSSAGGWLTELRDLNAQLWPAARQLLEAVNFMHQHGVAHLDLKPSNILIPLDGGRLSIIDFNTSIRVDSVRTKFSGLIGTSGYIPPEAAAGCGPFSAIRADLWACGKTLSELCDLCRPSAGHDALLQIFRELMDEDPEKRLMMSDALQRMDDLEPIALQGLGVREQNDGGTQPRRRLRIKEWGDLVEPTKTAGHA